MIASLALDDLEVLLERRPIDPLLKAVIWEVPREDHAVVQFLVEELAAVLDDCPLLLVEVLELLLAAHHVLGEDRLQRALERVVAWLQRLVLAEPPLLPHVQGPLADGPRTLVEGDHRRLVDGHERQWLLAQFLVALLGEERELARPPLHHEDRHRLHAELLTGTLGDPGDDKAADGVPQQCEGPGVHGLAEGFEGIVHKLVQTLANRLLLAVAVAGELVQSHLNVWGGLRLEDKPLLAEAVSDAVDAEQAEDRIPLHGLLAVVWWDLPALRLREHGDARQPLGPLHQREDAAWPRLVVLDDIALHLLSGLQPVLDLVLEVVKVHDGPEALLALTSEQGRFLAGAD
mmetsp:Transcript_61390/g.170227  ORF Transcript_61390/g.170227 Transcript_61390/m.170227 type:complete len:346 (-) Transcript_61390:29-1066(-)